MGSNGTMQTPSVEELEPATKAFYEECADIAGVSLDGWLTTMDDI